MSDEQKWRLDDTLQNIIDWPAIMKMDRYAGGHDQQMMGLFAGAKVIGHWNEGGYQGQVATCVLLPDGRYAVYNDYYGSCSGCDSWEDASDEEVRNMCIGLACGAYVFNSLEDVKEFLQTTDSDGWSKWCEGYRLGLLQSINEGDKDE